MGTLNPYYMLKNLFELISLKDDEDGKTLGPSARTRVRGMTNHLVKLSLHNIFNGKKMSKSI